MLARCYSGAIYGVKAHTVEIEVCAASGTVQFTIVGLPDQAVKEAKDRVSTAIIHSGYKRTNTNITVNLAPANLRKEGPIYDLPIAVALLSATGRPECPHLSDFALVGELALSGSVRPVRGILPIVLEMRRIGKRGILVPAENAAEAAIVDGIDVYPVRTLRDAVDFLSGRITLEPAREDLPALMTRGEGDQDDFADVKGQQFAKRALEVAVAGGHNVLMVGSPGAGKTMLARRIPSILPPMTAQEALDVTRIHSVAGALKSNRALVVERPFRAPHHTVSDIGLLGGGTHPIPGEVSLAHRGVLFLDEFPEFRRHVLEVLRQPLEDGHVAIARAAAAYDFPSNFMLVAAMNPCPCGYVDDPKHLCRCTPRQIALYRNKISGPLLDRIDIQIALPPVPFSELVHLPPGESSAAIRERVIAARQIQQQRFADSPGICCNADIRAGDLADVCQLDAAAQEHMRNLLQELDLSARAYSRVLKVARTIADLAESPGVTVEHVAEACTYRELDQAYWG